MLVRPRQDPHDDQDGRLDSVQDQAVQEVQCQRVLPLRSAVPVHSRHLGDKSRLDPVGAETKAGSGYEIAVAVAAARPEGELVFFERANFAAGCRLVK